MPPIPPSSRRVPGTLGAYLERHRLEQRVLRLEQVVAALRARAHDRGASGGGVPAPLAASLADFQRELAEVRKALNGQADTA